jgi:hypothetical protein
MPWKACHIMDERLRFVARLLDGERMTTLCTEFGISRKTGYKIYDRYKAFGLHGLNDRSRRAQRQANRLPLAIERAILGLKKRYPSWGAPKIREKLRPQCAADSLSRDQHRPCGARSAWAGPTPAAPPAAPGRDAAVTRHGAHCAVVCGF